MDSIDRENGETGPPGPIPPPPHPIYHIFFICQYQNNVMKTMTSYAMHYSYLLNLALLLNFHAFRHSKSVIEPCTASDPCTSYLSYRLPWELKLSEIAYVFQLNVSDILAANAMDWSRPTSWNQILPGKSVVKIPLSCPCVDGIRRFSTNYSVKVADSLDSIAESYGALVSVEQIKSMNNISDDNPITGGQSLMIPLPCTCFNNSNYGAAALYMSYVVQGGESLSSIAAAYGVTVGNLETVNGLGHPQIDPGDILSIPLPACSSANLNWYNESLIVPNGSFALTANNCINCSCSPNYLNLQCSPSGLVDSCSRLQCKGSNLFIGDAIQKRTPKGCNVTACVYRGHTGRKIHRSLAQSTNVPCTGNASHVGASVSPFPSSTDSVLTLSPAPSPSPYSVSSGPLGIASANHPASRETTAKSNTHKKLTSDASFFCLNLLNIALPLLLYN